MFFNTSWNLKSFLYDYLTLKRRIIIIFLFSSLIPFISIGLISYYTIYSILTNKIQSGIQSSLKQVELSLKNTLGLINNIWALVLGNGVPVFSVILVINYFRNLPKELEEAALVDGAVPWYILVKIFIPLAVPVLATVTLFSIVYHWNEFFNGLVLMSNAYHYPLQTYIQQLVVIIDANTMTVEQIQRMSELSNQTLNAAKIFIAMIPVLIIYPFLQRFFIHGITLGSV